MKKKILILTFLFSIIITAHASDIYYYQAQFAASIDSFKVGLNNKAAFDKLLVSLDTLQKGLATEAKIVKKEPLLSDIQSVYAFVGEVSPNTKSYTLTLTQKKKALKLLDVSEKMFNDTSYCLPVTELKLWDKYTCYLINNNSDSMMYTYKFNILIQGKYSSSTGYIDAGVSKSCARGIFKSYNNVNVKFTQERCDKELQVVKYIQPAVVQPKVEVYPEPDYLSPQQKQALKKKEKEKLIREKEKEKKQAEKDKEKKKKEIEKMKIEKKKEMLNERDSKMKDAAAKKEALKKESSDKKEKEKGTKDTDTKKNTKSK